MHNAAKHNYICFCCSGEYYKVCCQPYIEGKKAAPTPEALMRSRYSAYTQANIAYIEKTMRDDASTDFDPAAARVWAEKAKWLDLRVVKTTPVKDDVGYVEFKARYRLNGKPYLLHERSEFKRIKGAWYYVNGEQDGKPQKTIGKAYDTK